ncbi:aldo/keto reductase family oxidoreductase [Lactococcus hircilactis]|uniref:Aldo/keto reductase family oxidoreductase n=1 Tax=Lactococcus hircilactis TaxID=1494462 RepID=A0A7X2D1F1_9LACT|nr:aldo/keto reductase [Lactococcus hircilactis]MQW40508.1 aldo/keto reductase family oxidoreductase [Lactococcus hircilactis]
MKKIQIGEMSASQIVLGLMRINEKGKDPVRALETAYAGGINFYDHADIYGGGECEKIFAQALKESSIKREDIYIQSKVGIRPGIAFDFSKKHILNAVEGSMQRLGVDYLDSLLLHRPDTLVEPEEVAQAFSELESSGKVRHFGVSNQNGGQIELLKTAIKQPLLMNQLQFGVMHTGMVDAGIHVNMTDAGSVNHDNGLLEYSRIHQMTIQAWSPFQYGFFEGPFVGNEKFPKLNAELQTLADRYGVTPTGIAIAWINRHPANIQTVIGTITPSRIKEVCDASDVVLTREEWYAIYQAAGNILP